MSDIPHSIDVDKSDMLGTLDKVRTWIEKTEGIHMLSVVTCRSLHSGEEEIEVFSAEQNRLRTMGMLLDAIERVREG